MTAPVQVIAELVDDVCPPHARSGWTVGEVIYARTHSPADQAFVEDYLWLITNGESHRETIARRLGRTPGAMERHLWRLGFSVLHNTRNESRKASVAA